MLYRFFHLAAQLLIEDRGHLKLKELNMLWTVFVVLMLLWLLGLVSGYTLSGFIHILLVVALAAVLIRVIQGRSPL
jgi:hypothetical protein